jgi:hypothetical protein
MRLSIGVPAQGARGRSLDTAYDEELIDELAAAVGAALQGHPDRDEILKSIKERWVPILAAKRAAG